MKVAWTMTANEDDYKMAAQRKEEIMTANQDRGDQPHFTVQRIDLVREISLAVGSIDRRSTIPILGNIKIEALDGRLEIAATDLEISIATTCEAKVAQFGAITIPAKKLLEYIRLLPDGPIEVKVAANQWAHINCGRAKTKIAGLGIENFPTLPTCADVSITLSALAFARLVRQVQYAISTEETRFTLSGVLLAVTDGTITMVATDSHRLALSEMPVSGSKECRLLVPRKALGEVSKMAEMSVGGAVLEVGSDDNHIFFRASGRAITARKLVGNFPEYQRVLPKPESITGCATIDRIAFKAAIGRVRGFADERSHSLRIDVSEGEIKIHSALSDLGESEEIISAETTGAVAVGFNSDYLIHFLDSVTSDKVLMRYKDGGSGVVFEPVANNGGRVLCLVMPVRFSNGR